MVSRGQLYWAELTDPIASEPGYKRPVLVIQADTFNKSRINTVIVIAITSNLSLAHAPGNVRLPKSKSGLPRESVANVSQIVTLDKEFLGQMIGQLDTILMQQVDEGLKLTLDI